MVTLYTNQAQTVTKLVNLSVKSLSKTICNLLSRKITRSDPNNLIYLLLVLSMHTLKIFFSTSNSPCNPWCQTSCISSCIFICISYCVQNKPRTHDIRYTLSFKRNTPMLLVITCKRLRSKIPHHFSTALKCLSASQLKKNSPEEVLFSEQNLGIISRDILDHILSRIHVP